VNREALYAITQSGFSAIRAENLQTSGNNYTSIYGVSVGSDATTIRADASGAGATALTGWAQHSSSVNYAVRGRCDSPTGFDFYAYGAGTNYGSSSSRRWKNNIENIGDPLEKIAQLRGVYFDWDEEHGGHHDVGFIAEEIGAVLPEIVQYEVNGVDAIGMDYSKMTPLLVEAVNALQERNRVLEESNLALDDRIESLEQRLQHVERSEADIR